MWKKAAMLVVLAAGVSLSPGARAQESDAQHPNPALRCARVATAKAHRTVHAMRHQARHCARAITVLKAQGMDDRAAMVAEQCKGSINNKAAGGASAVQELVESCVAILSENGAPDDVIAALVEHAQRLVGRINAVRMNLIERIDGVLAGDGEADGGD